jgi:hypothetical protein
MLPRLQFVCLSEAGLSKKKLSWLARSIEFVKDNKCAWLLSCGEEWANFRVFHNNSVQVNDQATAFELVWRIKAWSQGGALEVREVRWMVDGVSMVCEGCICSMIVHIFCDFCSSSCSIITELDMILKAWVWDSWILGTCVFRWWVFL